jgi:hypothetical protein
MFTRTILVGGVLVALALAGLTILADRATRWQLDQAVGTDAAVRVAGAVD